MMTLRPRVLLLGLLFGGLALATAPEAPTTGSPAPTGSTAHATAPVPSAPEAPAKKAPAKKPAAKEASTPKPAPDLKPTASKKAKKSPVQPEKAAVARHAEPVVRRVEAKAPPSKTAKKNPVHAAKVEIARPPQPVQAKSVVPQASSKTPVHAAKAEVPPHHTTDMVLPLSGERDQVLDVARHFFDALLQGEPAKALESAALPFWLESERINDHDGLLRAWNRALGDERVDLLTLYSIELLTPREMLARYGKPPKRLAGFPWQGSNRYIAIANLSGHAAIAVLGRLPHGAWRVLAYTD